MTPMRDERAQAMATVCALIDEIDHGSDESVAATVDRLTAPEHAALLRAVVDELLQLSAAAVHAIAGEPGPDATYMLDLCDAEGVPTDIDRVDPPQRAVIRALLARLAGHEDDVAAQLDMALATADRKDAADVLSTALVWAMDTLSRNDSW
ncbi:hypothetical protein [Labedaea rhizosphaerae]|nr:hypothetical protein [Labedaea rhizosphaerae]